jgi:cytochrome c oxidase assembly protein subunit 15
VRLPAVTPAAYRRVTLLTVVALCAIIVTGAAVRLTGSGLGCPTWPSCSAGHLTPHGENGSHVWVEFLNRVFTGMVSVAIALAVLAAWRRAPRRRDLVWLSLGLVAGLIGQIVLGGISVRHHLAPPFVMGHFLLSLVLVADAVALHHRAGEDAGPRRPTAGPELRTAAGWLVAIAAVVLVTGTVVTGTGPHGGDTTARRLHFDITDVARVHGIAVNVLVAGTLLFLWLAHRRGAPALAVRRARILLAVEVAQAAVGYTQYFNGVPEALVALHVLGAVSVWLAVLGLALSMHRHDAAPPDTARAVDHALAVA